MIYMITSAIMGFFRKSKAVAQKVLRTKKEYRNIKKKRALCESVVLSKEQRREIDAFFQKHYGKKMPYHWHRLYQSYTGTYCKDYFPEILLSTELEPTLNNRETAKLLSDKNLLELLFDDVADVHIPKTFGSCVRSVCRDENKDICTIAQLAERIGNIGKCVVKKTVDSDSGRDVSLCDFQDGVDVRSGKQVADVLLMFGRDFVVQEKIEQSAELAALNETSVNTFRVMSYICQGKINVCPLALRLGRNNADKDNIHYGGVCVGVKPDGTLRKQAFAEYGEAFSAHPDSGVVFEGYKIPCTEKLADTAKRLHARVPYLGIISWDLTLDKNGVVTLIEMNTDGQSAWFPQMVNGQPLFGEDTPEMLALISKNRKK